MRRAVSSSLLGLALVALLLLPSSAWGQSLAVLGPGPIAPASDSPGYLAPSNETVHPPPPRGYAIDIRQAKEDAASTRGVAPAGVQYDRGVSTPASWAQPLDQLSLQPESSPSPPIPALITSFSGIAHTGFFPPDPVVAAGPTNLVLVTNGSVTIKDKTGAFGASTSLDAFFTPVRAASEGTFDPRVVFDTGSSRFFLSATGQVDNPSCTVGTCVSHFFLAVSKTSTPATTGSGDWYFYAFDATLNGTTPTANWADFPGLGVDSSMVVLTANMFSFNNDTFKTSKIRILDKSLLIAGGAVTWFDFFALRDPSSQFLSFSLQPALTFGSPGTFFLVSASASNQPLCDIVVWGIQGPPSSPTLSALRATAGGTCDVPPNAPQSGGGKLLDTGDTRLLNAVYRNGSLWTAQSILMNFGSGNVSAIRWVQIDATSWPTTVGLIQDSTFGADGIWYFYPVVMVDGSNNLALSFARSSPSEFGSASYTGRLGTDPPNTLQPSALLKAGTANYQLVEPGPGGLNRWGDYYGIALDPSDGSFWVLGEYAAASNKWGTWVGQLEFFSTGASAFVTRLYEQVLGREPEPGGVASWVQQIEQFTSVVPTVLAFFHVPEFQSQHLPDDEFVRLLYRVFLGREADPGGFNAFMSLLTGCLTRDNLLDLFIDLQEFRAQTSFLPPLDPITAFVINLYVRILGRGPDPGGLQFFVAQLQQTQTVLPSVRQFLAARNTSNTEFVTLLYRVLLNRVPDCPGLGFWVAQLAIGAATRDQLVAQFAASAEFQAIQRTLFL